MTRIERAQKFAHLGHDSIGQKRKYTGEPYWVHTDEVARLVAGVRGATEDMIVAAHLHDLEEDVHIYPYSLKGIYEEFGATVVGYVRWLTHLYTPETYPELNRATRKYLEADRLSGAPLSVRTVKVADIVANTASIVNHDANFAKVYVPEGEHLLDKIGYLVDDNLWEKAFEQLRDARKKLGI